MKVKLPDSEITTNYTISTSYPKKNLVGMGDTLGALGIEDQDTLIVEKF